MSSSSGTAAVRTGFLRAPRRGAEVRLGADGRVPSAADAQAAAFATPEVTASAANIVDLAQQRADVIVREAALGAAAVQQEAYTDGFTAGQRDGALAAREELAQALALVQQVGREAQAIRAQAVTQAEHELVELVLAATGAVIGQAATDPDFVHQTVLRALERAGSQNVIRVRVSPDEQARVAARLVEEHGDPPPFAVIADGLVQAGGCIVDTASGRVDARLDVQISEIATLLRNALPAAPAWAADAGTGAADAA